jgi:hypothetical protein
MEWILCILAIVAFVVYFMRKEATSESAREHEEVINRAAEGLRKFRDKAKAKGASDENAPDD